MQDNWQNKTLGGGVPQQLPRGTMPQTIGQGWICPKCDRVYGPLSLECHACNKVVRDRLHPKELGDPMRSVASGSIEQNVKQLQSELQSRR